MNGFLTAQDISYDRDLYLQSHQEKQEYYMSDIQVAFEYVDQVKENEPSIVQSFFLKTFVDKLYKINTMDPAFFITEEIQKPSEAVLDQAYHTIQELAVLNIFPEKLEPSAEDGICIQYKNKNAHNLYFELYNNGEFGYLIEDPMLKKVIHNEDFDHIDDALQSIQAFVNR